MVTLKPDRHWCLKLAIVGAFAVLYAVMFVVLYPHIGFAGAPFAAVMVISAAWLFGWRGGVVASLLLVVQGLLLLNIVGTGMTLSALRGGFLAGFLTMVILGVAVGRMSDLDRQVKAYAHQLQLQAFHDPLTGLPNRTLFADRLQHAADRVARENTAIAILFLDLDGFKRINDEYGHAAGDRLLCSIARRLQDTLRRGDTLARLGGDEFVILLEDLQSVECAQEIAARLTRVIEQPFVIDRTPLSVTSSIGISFCPSGQIRSEELLREADRAMYRAKSSGSGRYEVFQPMVA